MTDLRETPNEQAHPVGPVDLRLPSDPSMSKVLRLAASGVASLCDFTLDEIEEIKLAVSEVLVALVEHGAGEPVDVRFEVTPGEFAISGATAAPASFDLEHPDLVLCRMVLDDVCTTHDIAAPDREVQITATLRRPFRGV